MAKKNKSNTSPPKFIRLLRECSSLALLGVSLYLVLIFYGYDRADPGWSSTSGASPIQNQGGLG